MMMFMVFVVLVKCDGCFRVLHVVCLMQLYDVVERVVSLY